MDSGWRGLGMGGGTAGAGVDHPPSGCWREEGRRVPCRTVLHPQHVRVGKVPHTHRYSEVTKAGPALVDGSVSF